MKKIFSKNNINLDPIGLGTYDLKGNICEQVITKALSIGYRHIDTAQIYQNEKEIGRAVSNSLVNREDLFITSKISINIKNSQIHSNIEKTLENLKTNYLNLLLIHWPIFDTSLEDLLEILEDLKNKNLIKLIGVSNFNIQLIEECIALGYDIFCNQIEFHPYLSQEKIYTKLTQKKILPVAYRPLFKGKLNMDLEINKIANKYNKTTSQLTLKWAITKGWIVIPMSTNENHLRENIDIFDFEIKDHDMEKLDRHGKKNIRDVKNISKYEWDD